MAWVIKTFWFLPLLILCATPVYYGCEGSKPREQVNDTVKELSGQKNVERMEQMKKDIGAIQSQQEDRLKQLDESADK
ncbi:MAG: hypothetical protein JRF37_11055 [Deltaproteobacteria bacterium]|nr:hypothetical protein [Deltaproteobacteria bacterium]